jgi:hypothetical protein
VAPQLQQLGCSKKRFCGICGVVLRLTDGRASRMQALQGERCDGIRQESMFEVRLFGATPWAAALEIKKNGEPGSSPFFLVPYAAATCRRHLRRRAPQKRCVNGCQNSRPGGVILSPFRALATTIRFYSRATPDASEIFIIRTAAPLTFAWAHCATRHRGLHPTAHRRLPKRAA